MNSATNHPSAHRIRAGTALSLLLALLALGAAGCARPYVASTTVLVGPGGGGGLESVRSHLPSGADIAVTPIPETDLIQIRVADDDPARAAERANQLVGDLLKQVAQDSPDLTLRVVEMAQAPRKRTSWP